MLYKNDRLRERNIFVVNDFLRLLGVIEIDRDDIELPGRETVFLLVALYRFFDSLNFFLIDSFFGSAESEGCPGFYFTKVYNPAFRRYNIDLAETRMDIGRDNFVVAGMKKILRNLFSFFSDDGFFVHPDESNRSFLPGSNIFLTFSLKEGGSVSHCVSIEVELYE